jgi:hypothetical protein
MQLEVSPVLPLSRKSMLTEGITGSHVFQGWNGNLLTDSGGFQMVSLYINKPLLTYMFYLADQSSLPLVQNYLS